MGGGDKAYNQGSLIEPVQIEIPSPEPNQGKQNENQEE